MNPRYQIPELVDLKVGILEMGNAGDGFIGRFIETRCRLLPAVVRYEVTLSDGKIDLAQIPGQGEVLAIANNTAFRNTHGEDVIPLTLYGLGVDMRICLNQNASMLRYPGVGNEWLISLDSGTANKEVWKYTNWSVPSPYTGFLDPTDDILFTFNKYLLRAATLAATWSNASQLIDKGLSVQQTVQGQTLPIVYHSDLRWYAGAAIIELLTIVVILPLFYGWWSLGSDTSLSPFNIALAFRSPVLQGANSASGGRGVVRELGDKRVAFGVIDLGEVHGSCDACIATGAQYSRLGVAEVQSVNAPRKGEKFNI